VTPKKLLIIVLASFLVIVAVACGLRACAAPAVEKLQEQAQEAARVEAARQEAAGLTSADLAAVNAYDDGQNDMASFLEANLWIASNGTSQLRFERGYYIQTDNEGNEQVGKIVLGHVDAKTTSTDNVTTHTRTAAISSNDGPNMLTITQTTDKDKKTKTTVQSTALPSSGTYELTQAADTVTIEKPPDNVIDACGGTEAFEAMTSELADYLALNNPTASRASWTNTAYIDYAEKTVRIEYKLDDKSLSTIPIVMGFSGKVVSIGKN